MGQKVSKNTNYSIYGHTFFASRAENLYVNQGDYYLSIGYKEFWFWALIAIFDFLVPVGALKKGVATQKPIWVWDLKTLPKR